SFLIPPLKGEGGPPERSEGGSGGVRIANAALAERPPPGRARSRAATLPPLRGGGMKLGGGDAGEEIVDRGLERAGLDGERAGRVEHRARGAVGLLDRLGHGRHVAGEFARAAR